MKRIWDKSYVTEIGYEGQTILETYNPTEGLMMTQKQQLMAGWGQKQQSNNSF